MNPDCGVDLRIFLNSGQDIFHDCQRRESMTISLLELGYAQVTIESGRCLWRRSSTILEWDRHKGCKAFYDRFKTCDKTKKALRPVYHLQRATLEIIVISSSGLFHSAFESGQRHHGFRCGICSELEHSKALSLASLRVVAKQHSVVTPLMIR